MVIYMCVYMHVYSYVYKYSKGKGKAIPLQAWTDLKDSRRLRFTDFKIIGT
jgi:hypothetical protein